MCPLTHCLLYLLGEHSRPVRTKWWISQTHGKNLIEAFRLGKGDKLELKSSLGWRKKGVWSDCARGEHSCWCKSGCCCCCWCECFSSCRRSAGILTTSQPSEWFPMWTVSAICHLPLGLFLSFCPDVPLLLLLLAIVLAVCLSLFCASDLLFSLIDTWILCFSVGSTSFQSNLKPLSR